MKQKDWAVVIIISFVSAIFSFVISNQIFGSPKQRQQEVEVVTPISAEFPTPDGKYFNDKALDPTQLIKIGDTNNNAPFNGQ